MRNFWIFFWSADMAITGGYAVKDHSYIELCLMIFAAYRLYREWYSDPEQED